MPLCAQRGFRLLASTLIIAAFANLAFSCSVLSHEAVIDALWDVKLQPLLLARFPNSTPSDMKRAHGYAYGGSIIQDLGYYPHGAKEFSDLTHYVRTGEFVEALISESHTMDELAFALGALSHYISDIDVHRLATNPGEAMLYPKLRRKFGSVVTYEDDPAAHLKTEFGFDVLEVAKGRFAPEAYHDFIGFYVAQALLDRAFHDTYGLELADVFQNFDRTIGSYRRAVSKTIPKATRIAWAQRQDQIQKSEPGMTRARFVYVMRRSSYEQEWGKQYDRPSAGERLLAILLKLVPPVGPLRALQFRMPTPPVEELFMESFDHAVAQCNAQLDNVNTRKLHLDDVNYDLGTPAAPGTYRLEDDAYAFWLGKLADKHFQTATPQIRQVLLGYFKDPNASSPTRKDTKQWKRLESELSTLQVSSGAAGAL